MKKYLIILPLLFVGAGAFAQGWQDAYLFSQNEYGGTARSAAVGNAVTALGGDPGTIGINPAGSSVNSYSQFMFTSGFSLGNGWSVGTIAQGDTEPIGYGDEVTSHYLRYKVPNAGMIMNFDSGRRHGLKRMSVGFVMNSTGDYTSRLQASGVNANNCFGGFLGSYADGFSSDVMGNEDWFYNGELSNMPPWIAMTAYRSGMISGVTNLDGAYVSLSEVFNDGEIRLAAPVFQRYGRQTRGYKQDWVMNFSANWDDKFFLGANLGITSVYYNMLEYWEESPENESEFPPIEYTGDPGQYGFQSMLMKRHFVLDGSGMYAKAGFIWVPVQGVRLGGAIQTPTIMSITEKYGYSGEVNLRGRSPQTANSPEDYWGYDMVYPFRYNLGAAFTFGQYAIVSADYEGVNYSQSKFKVPADEGGYYDADTFYNQNKDIKDILGTSHAFRLGVEFKPMPGIAVRTGYNYITSGIKDGSEGAKQIVSFGLGYSSSGSFYADCSLRFRFLPDEYIIPYYYYIVPDPAKYYYKEIDDSVMTPEIRFQSSVAEAMVTVGWRF